MSYNTKRVFGWWKSQWMPIAAFVSCSMLCWYLHIKYISSSKHRISGKSFPGKPITQDAMSLIKRSSISQTFFFLALCTVQLSKTRKELFTCSRGWVRIHKGHKQAEFKPNVKCINDETGTIWQRKDGWRWTCRFECWHWGYFTGK